MAKKGSVPAPQNHLASNGVYVLMEEITMESCRNCLTWIMNHNLAENRLPQLTLIINSPAVFASFLPLSDKSISTHPVNLF